MDGEPKLCRRDLGDALDDIESALHRVHRKDASPPLVERCDANDRTDADNLSALLRDLLLDLDVFGWWGRGEPDTTGPGAAVCRQALNRESVALSDFESLAKGGGTYAADAAIHAAQIRPSNPIQSY